MNLSTLLDLIRRAPGYESSLEALSSRTPQSLPLLSAVRTPAAAAIAADIAAPTLIIAPRADRVLALAQELPAWLPELEVVTFPEPEPLFYEPLPWGNQTRLHRIRTLGLLAQGRACVVLASARSLMSGTIAPDQYLKFEMRLSSGEPLELLEFVGNLVAAGYEDSSIVTGPGEFSRRGGILDVWPASDPDPIRIELFGDRADSIRIFDPRTQRSQHPISSTHLPPAREGIPGLVDFILEEEGLERGLRELLVPWVSEPLQSILDYLPSQSLVLIDDLTAVETAIHELEAQAVELRKQTTREGRVPPRPYLTVDELTETLEQAGRVDLGMAQLSEFGDSFVPGPRFGGQLQPLLDHLDQRRLAHESVVLVSRQAPRLADIYSDRNGARPVLDDLPDALLPGELYFMKGALTEGWTLRTVEDLTIHLLTDAEIFGWSRPKLRRRPQVVVPAPESDYADLQPGDYVVHVDYGVGIFEGLVSRTLEDLEREYLLIAYQAGDQVYVPIHQADRITRYVGSDGAEPKLSRLGTQEWDRVRARARKAVEAIAQELLELYAKRMTVVGHTFSEDTVWQAELEASFPYVETEDQIRALEAVKSDMQGPRPMDRLICGDVGYGKTEVALRAAFKAVMDGKQVGMLVPTTVLAQQHFQTFRRRLAAFPVQVEMLSRFRTKAEAKQILEELAAGRVDIVVGTHRLLQKDVSFKELGLLIVDEEQRFGVTHKEYLKSLRTEVDVLTLTATPIPRTLYMSLTGVRDISTIDTAPEDRLPVVTHSGPYDPALIRQAILREIDRAGQVFFVHNRVQSIATIKKRLTRLVPEAQIEIAHGQMPERELAEVMKAFNAGKINVLLSTSIIESGLDIPNANTLIVDRADRFGLAQLYQLRGRVGRGAVRAYAYLFHQTQYRSNEEALQRLEIISENTRLGAGYSIALRDLEMRGAGDLLGKRQHGHIAAVGFHYYTQLLSSAVRRLRSDRFDEAMPELAGEGPPVQVSIELPLASALTAEYVPDRKLRLQLYRRLAGLRSLDEVAHIRAELIDRFGDPPLEVENLLYQLRAKLLAAAGQISGISSENGQILLQLRPDRIPEDLGALGSDLRRSKRGLWLVADDWQSRLLEILGKFAESEESPARQAQVPA
jgi:transcription-repair coupling factor (superfamily II helicase)